MEAYNHLILNRTDLPHAVLLRLVELELEIERIKLQRAQLDEPDIVQTIQKPRVDWVDAPTWARYHAFDANAEGNWYEEYPKRASVYWTVWNSKEHQAKSEFTLPLDRDWRTSVTAKI